MNSDEKNKRVQNLFRSLQNDPKSIFYTTNKLSKWLIKKAKTAFYDKDKVFVNLYEQLEDKDFYKNENLPLVSPFIDKETNIDHSTLYSFSMPFQMLHTDIADLRFLAKSASDPKYCLLLVDLFNSKICVYPMKNRSLLAKKLELFYMDIQPKRTGKMRLQTDLEYIKIKLNNSIKNLMLKCFIHNFVEGKILLQNKKLENLKILY